MRPSLLLLCAVLSCASPSTSPSRAGRVGEPCFGNGTCDDGLECREDTCIKPRAPQGMEGGSCYPNNTCDGALECIDTRCRRHGAVDGAPGGRCGAGGTCNAGLTCEDGACWPAPGPRDGTEGGPCYGNATCNAGLVCRAGTCRSGTGGGTADSGGGTTSGTPPGPGCVDDGGDCSWDGECCSGPCSEGVCAASGGTSSSTASGTAAPAAMCDGEWILGSTFYSGSGVTMGHACDQQPQPRNCLDGHFMIFPDGECICILSCAKIQVQPGEACNAAGTWTCQDIVSSDGAQSGRMCVANAWNICTADGTPPPTGGGSCLANDTACGDPNDCCSLNCLAGTCQPHENNCVSAGFLCEVDSECCSGWCDSGHCAEE